MLESIEPNATQALANTGRVKPNSNECCRSKPVTEESTKLNHLLSCNRLIFQNFRVVPVVGIGQEYLTLPNLDRTNTSPYQALGSSVFTNIYRPPRKIKANFSQVQNYPETIPPEFPH
jgi:hypothetical protein